LELTPRGIRTLAINEAQPVRRPVLQTSDKSEIVAPIGAGGMGELWKARAMRLGRAVAIKVSRKKFSDHSSARLARSPPFIIRHLL
jgi:serine/threonine protein kinase